MSITPPPSHETDAVEASKGTDLSASLARLRAFRATWNEQDQIDARSGLVARDLDRVMWAAESGGGLPHAVQV